MALIKRSSHNKLTKNKANIQRNKWSLRDVSVIRSTALMIYCFCTSKWARVYQTIAIGLMWLDKKAVLDIIDTQTQFSSAAFLDGLIFKDVWDDLYFCCVTQCTGVPLNIKIDQGSWLPYLRWTCWAEEVVIKIETSVVEVHNSLGLRERYHEPLRRVFKKIEDKNPEMKREMYLRLAIKAFNDTTGPEGLVLSYLVFGCIPRFSSVNSSHPTKKERMKAMEKGIREISSTVAKLVILSALLLEVLRNADAIFQPGDQARTFWE